MPDGYRRVKLHPDDGTKDNDLRPDRGCLRVCRVSPLLKLRRISHSPGLHLVFANDQKRKTHVAHLPSLNSHRFGLVKVSMSSDSESASNSRSDRHFSHVNT